MPRGPLLATEDRERHPLKPRRARRQGNRGSVALIGPTGSGKTALAASAIATWDGPVVAVSRRSATCTTRPPPPAPARGEIAVFDPGMATGLATARWSPLEAVTTSSGALRTGRALAQAIPPQRRHQRRLLGQARREAARRVHGRRRPVPPAQPRPGRAAVPGGQHGAHRHLGDDDGRRLRPGHQPAAEGRPATSGRPLEVKLIARHASVTFIGVAKEDHKIRSSIYSTASHAIDPWLEPSVAHSATDDPRHSYNSTESWERAAPAHRPRLVDGRRPGPGQHAVPDRLATRVRAALPGARRPPRRPQGHHPRLGHRRPPPRQAAAHPHRRGRPTRARLAARRGVHHRRPRRVLRHLLAEPLPDPAPLRHPRRRRAVRASHQVLLRRRRRPHHHPLPHQPPRLRVRHPAVDTPTTCPACSAGTATAGAACPAPNSASTSPPPNTVRQMDPGEAVLLHGTLPPIHLEAVRWWNEKELAALVPLDDDGNPTPPADLPTCPLGRDAPAAQTPLVDETTLASTLAELPKVARRHQRAATAADRGEQQLSFDRDRTTTANPSTGAIRSEDRRGGLTRRFQASAAGVCAPSVASSSAPERADSSTRTGRPWPFACHPVSPTPQTIEILNGGQHRPTAATAFTKSLAVATFVRDTTSTTTAGGKLDGDRSAGPRAVLMGHRRARSTDRSLVAMGGSGRTPWITSMMSRQPAHRVFEGRGNRTSRRTRSWCAKTRMRRPVADAASSDVLEQAEFVHAVDRLAAGRDAELAVDRDRLGLDRVSGDVQPLPDLPKREVGGQQREEPKLGGRQRRCPRPSARIVSTLARSSSACCGRLPRAGRCWKMSLACLRTARAPPGSASAM